MRIYADSLKPNIPYKTILLSTTDPADFAVAEALEKYGLEKENPRDYCIARVSAPRPRGRGCGAHAGADVALTRADVGVERGLTFCLLYVRIW